MSDYYTKDKKHPGQVVCKLCHRKFTKRKVYKDWEEYVSSSNEEESDEFDDDIIEDDADDLPAPTLAGVEIPVYDSTMHGFAIDGDFIPADEFDLVNWVKEQKGNSKDKEKVVGLSEQVIKNAQISGRTTKLTKSLGIEGAIDGEEEWVELFIDDFEFALHSTLEHPFANLPTFSRQILKPRTITSMVSRSEE